MGTPFGTRFGTKLGTQWPADGGSAPPAFSGVIDAMIAGGGRAPRTAFSISHRLYSSYTGPLFLLREASGGTTTPIGYGADGLADEAAIAAHCGAANGTIVTLYDQSGNGADVTQATPARQPKIYDGATTSVLKQGSLPWPVFPNAAVSASSWARADSAGIVGAVAVSHAYFGARIQVDSFLRIAMSVGTASNARFGVGAQVDSGDPVQYTAAAAFRQFTPTTPTDTPRLMIHAIGAGQQIGSSTCRQDGAALVESAVGGGTGTTSIGNVSYTIGSYAGGNNGYSGGACFWMSDDIAWSGGALAALEAFGLELEALS